MISKVEVLAAIDAILSSLKSPLTTTAASEGWYESFRAFWEDYYRDLRHRVETGDSAKPVDFTVVVGLDMLGLSNGTIASQAARISAMLRWLTGHHSPDDPLGEFKDREPDRTRSFSRAVDLIDSSGQRIGATLRCESHYGERGSRNCIIYLQSQRHHAKGEGPDHFEAFCRVREALEPHGVRPFCYGASRNVFPSGMARDMGEGVKAYKTQIGRRGGELVSIFESGSDVEPVTVQEQAAFHDAWLCSFGSPR
jgi:hypothetical protein